MQFLQIPVGDDGFKSIRLPGVKVAALMIATSEQSSAEVMDSQSFVTATESLNSTPMTVASVNSADYWRLRTSFRPTSVSLYPLLFDRFAIAEPNPPAAPVIKAVFADLPDPKLISFESAV